MSREPHEWNLVACRCNRCGASLQDVGLGRLPPECPGAPQAAGAPLNAVPDPVGEALRRGPWDRIDARHKR